MSQVSGLSNNIDFLVQIVRHPGFHTERPTTAFFDHYMTDIMNKLNPPPIPGKISLHTAFGLIAQSFQDRTPVCESPRMTSFEPFNSARCGSWRAVGTVKNVIQTSTETVQVETSGDSFVFSPVSGAHKKGRDAAHPVGLHANVLSVRKIVAHNSYENVWEIALEIDGHRRTATVSCYRTGALGAQNTEIDGKTHRSAPLILAISVARWPSWR